MGWILFLMISFYCFILMWTSSLPLHFLASALGISGLHVIMFVQGYLFLIESGDVEPFRSGLRMYFLIVLFLKMGFEIVVIIVCGAV